MIKVKSNIRLISSKKLNPQAQHHKVQIGIATTHLPIYEEIIYNVASNSTEIMCQCKDSSKLREQ